MSMVVHPDVVETLSFERERGLSRRARRRLKFEKVAGTTWPRMVSRVRSSMDLSQFRMNSSFSAEFNQLRVVKHDMRLIEGTKSFVAVDVDYEHIYLRPEWEGGTEMETVTSQRDAAGLPIQVAYQYPDDYKDNTELRGKLVVQGGSATFTLPKPYIETWITVTTNNPPAVILSWAGHTNSDVFFGWAPRTVMCSVPTFQRFNSAPTTFGIGPTPAMYNFRFRFLFDLLGVDEDVVFQDPNTNRPPADFTDQATATARPQLIPQRPFSPIVTGAVA